MMLKWNPTKSLRSVCTQSSESSEEENLNGTWGCQHGAKGEHETGDKSISYTRRCRGSAFTCTDEINPYFPTLAGKLAKAIHFERDPKHLRGISPKCIDCIDPTWNRLAAANMQRPAANFSFQGRRSLTTWNPGMWETHLRDVCWEKLQSTPTLCIAFFVLAKDCADCGSNVVHTYIPFLFGNLLEQAKVKALDGPAESCWILRMLWIFAEKVMRRFWELWELVWLIPCSFHVHWFIYSKNGSINQHTGHGWTSLSPADGSSDWNQRGTCCKIEVDMHSQVSESECTFLPNTDQCINVFLALSCFLAYFALQSRNFRTRQKSTRTSPSNPTKQ